MEVRADINRADYEAFRRHAERRALAGLKRPSFRVLIVVWAIAAVIFSWLYTTTDWAPRYIVSAGIGVVLGFVVYNWTAKLQHADLSPEEGGYVLGVRTFATFEDGLRVSSANTELVIRRAAMVVAGSTSGPCAHARQASMVTNSVPVSSR